MFIIYFYSEYDLQSVGNTVVILIMVIIAANVFSHFRTVTGKKGLATENKTGSTNHIGEAVWQLTYPGADGPKKPVKK